MSQHGVIGGRATRVDAWDKVTGFATYPGDLVLDGLLHAVVLRSPHPHARIRGLNLEAARAQADVVVALSGFNLKSVDNPPATKGEGPLAGIKWVLQNPAIGTTVPFMRTIPELEMNFRAMSEPYTPEDEKLLFSMNEQIRPDYCRMCYECRGQCPKGMPVTDVLRFLAYHDFGGNYHQAVASFRGLEKEARDVRCSDCSSCAIKCPNGVHVQERLIRAQELLA